jgi:hypothetical protein
MKGARESPSLMVNKTLPTVNSDLIVRSIAENKLLETLSCPADAGGFFQHLSFLAMRADGISVNDETSLHLRLGIVVIAVIANNRVGDVDFPNIHFNHAPF